MPDTGLDAEKLQTLMRWAHGLRNDQRPEVAAAGRAIELLIDEIERLHVLLWGTRLYPEAEPPHAPEPSAAATPTIEEVWSRSAAPEPDAPDEEVAGSLQERLRGRLRIHSRTRADS